MCVFVEREKAREKERACVRSVGSNISCICVCKLSVRMCVCVRVSPRVQSYIVSLFDYVIKTVSLCVCRERESARERESVCAFSGQ